MSIQANITADDDWWAGEDKQFIFTVYDQNTSPPVVRDITGWTITWKLSIVLNGPAILTKAAALTTPALGVCTVTVASGDSINLDPGIPYYYILRKTDSGSRAELAQGSVVLLNPWVD